MSCLIENCLNNRKVFTQRENYERLLADSEDRLAKVSNFSFILLQFFVIYATISTGVKLLFFILRATESTGCLGHSTLKSMR